LKRHRHIALLTALLFAIPFNLWATHNRAGEITYKQTGELTFKITVITYTSTGPEPVADRPELEVQFGDGTKASVPRIEQVYLPDYYKRNKYVWEHTYPGPGTYQIVVEDPNRNRGVKNIPNSVNVVFSIKTILVINPGMGNNSTPILLNPPIDKAALGYTFIHNPAAFDPDGDSLSYKLAICTAENGKEIAGYTFPPFSDSLVVDERTGDLIWAAPTEVGKYNVAMTIEEWRHGVKIGRIQRDMQIEVYTTDNQPPVIEGTGRFCLLAGQSFIQTITATDPNGDSINLSASGGPLSLEINPAQFRQITSSPGRATGSIRWNTDCTLVRKQPYQIIIKAKDLNSELQLIDSKNFEILVICPRVENLMADPYSSYVTLTWNPAPCANAAGYRIYRKTGTAFYDPGQCETGLPAELGYTMVKEVRGHSSTQFMDTNGGKGLEQSIDYCYRVVAFFDDGAESIASGEFCTRLVRGYPLITKVSVKTTDPETGQIELGWRKPGPDQLKDAKGPYVYQIYRSENLFGQNGILIDSLQNLEDTSYLDKGMNTAGKYWSYTLELWNREPGNNFRIGEPQVASQVDLRVESYHRSLKLILQKNVPWKNEKYVIYRQTGNREDSIGVTAGLEYFDRGLLEGNTYCYRVKSTGSFEDLGVSNLINYSQISCAVPIDTIPPCPPILTVTSVCDSLSNRLLWNNVNDSCCSDAAFYRVYYRNSLEGDLLRIDSVSPADKTEYWHFPEKTMAGCYAVSAIDSVGNESILSNVVCVDDCINYSLPNVFTPNGDGINDLLKPNPYNRVEKIKLQVFSRWNTLVFQTEDPEINWDGKHIRTGRTVSPGVYYYVCDVYEHRLTGIVPRYLTGFIHVLYSDLSGRGK